jgi:hypothetical protein
VSQTRKDRRSVRELLVALAGVDLVPDLVAVEMAVERATPQAWRVLGLASDRHGITRQVAAGLGEHPGIGPEEIGQEIRRRAMAHQAAHLRASDALDDVRQVLDAESPTWALLKGAALADHAYRVSGRRSFSDIDVLVPPAAVRSTLVALESTGAKLVTRNWAFLRKHGKGELVLALPNGTPLDLHWSLLSSPRSAPRLTFSTTELLSGTRRVHLRGPLPITVPVLSRADQLLHVAVHAVLAGFGPLKYALDLDQLCRHDSVEVDALIAAAQRAGASLPLAVALARARSVLNSPAVPAPRPTPSGGRIWLAAMGAVDRLNPPTRAHEAAPMPFWTGSTRHSTRSSLGALGRFGAERASLLASPSELVRRLKHLEVTGIPDEELLDIDGGHREALLQELDAS